jgi:chemotaxis methyl-accepting protein methylase
MAIIDYKIYKVYNISHMQTLIRPEAVEVEVPPLARVPGQLRVAPMRTALFRAGVNLPEAFDAAADGLETGDEFSFISAGCSMGAEVDSVLAHYRGAGGEGAVRARGYDVSERAIETAREGRHVASRQRYKNPRPVVAALEPLGFETEICEPIRDDPIQRPYAVIKSGTLREGHDVRFQRQNLWEPMDDSGKAHLILANHLLYHLEAAQAVQVIRNLSTALRHGGILSFDAYTAFVDTQRAQSFTAVLAGELAMEPVYYGNRGMPTMFRQQER